MQAPTWWGRAWSLLRAVWVWGGMDVEIATGRRRKSKAARPCLHNPAPSQIPVLPIQDHISSKPPPSVSRNNKKDIKTDMEKQFSLTLVRKKKTRDQGQDLIILLGVFQFFLWTDRTGAKSYCLPCKVKAKRRHYGYKTAHKSHSLELRSILDPCYHACNFCCWARRTMARLSSMGEMKGSSYLGKGSAGVGHIRVELAPQPLTTGCPDLVQELPIRPVTDSQVGEDNSPAPVGRHKYQEQRFFQ